MSWEDYRAKDYEKLDWVHDPQALNPLIEMCQLKSTDVVMDAGTGTGVVAKAVAQYVKNVIAVDSSQNMLNIAKKTVLNKNVKFMKKDVVKGSWQNAMDCIVARMFFHHLEMDDWAAIKMFGYLKEGGRLVIMEGIPPVGCESFYHSIFQEKEERNVYTVDGIIHLFANLFKVEDFKIIKTPNMSINNWLGASGLSSKKKEKIFNMHLDAPGYVKKAYEMKFVDGDILMTWQSAIVRGVK